MYKVQFLFNTGIESTTTDFEILYRTLQKKMYL